MILDILLNRKPEKEKTKRSFSLQNFANYMDQWFGGEFRTSTGIHLTTDGALAIATVYACVRKLSEGVSTIPLILYRRIGEGKERAVDHPLYNLLRYNPSPEISAWEFWDYIMQSALLRGNAYARKVFNKKGQLVKLIPYHPDRMQLKVENGILYYLFSRDDGTKERVELNQIFRVRGPLSRDGITGLNIVEQLCEMFGHVKSLDDYSAKLFSKGARLSGVLQYPRRFADRSAQERLIESWNRMTSGPDNAHRIAILEDGMTFQQISMTAEDAQLLEARKFSVEEICRVFGIPPHKIGHLEKATFSNIEHQDLEWVRDSVRPWLVRIEQSIHRDLLTEDEKASGNLFAEFLVDGLLRGDTHSRNQSYATGRQWGWLSINDIRRMENLNPIPKGGDDYIIPINMKVVGEESSNVEDSPAAIGNNPAVQPVKSESLQQDLELTSVGDLKIVKSDDVVSIGRDSAPTFELDIFNRLYSALQPLFKSAMERIVRKEINAIGRLVKKELPEEEFQNKLNEFYLDHQNFVNQIMEPIFSAFAKAYDQNNLDINNYVQEFCRRYCETNHKEYLERNFSDIVLSWKNGRIDEIFSTEIKNFSSYLAEKFKPIVERS